LLYRSLDVERFLIMPVEHSQWKKSPKGGLKECHIVKNTLLQTAFSVIYPLG